MRLHSFSSLWEPAPRPLHAGTTLFAIGDVHGQSAHLAAMLGLLRPLLAAATADGARAELVMLGDYVDRGPDSLGVLTLLDGLGRRLGIPVHTLLGNHDDYLLDFLRGTSDPDQMELWWYNGGNTTLAELDITADDLARTGLPDLAARAAERLGHGRLALLKGLELYHRHDPYLFVHAGLHPERAFERQERREFLWIRAPFLGSKTWHHPFTVVHGHTVLGPQVLPHRIAVDSGCFATGVLTMVELARDRARFHAVTSDQAPDRFRQLVGPDRMRTFTEPVPLSP